MAEVLTTVIASFAAGSAVGWLLRSALARYGRQFRDFEAVAVPECVEIQTTEPIDQIRRTLQTAELLLPQEDIGAGPLVPDGETCKGSAS